MSGYPAIGAAGAALRNLLDNGMIDTGPSVGTVKSPAVASVEHAEPERPRSAEVAVPS